MDTPQQLHSHVLQAATPFIQALDQGRLSDPSRCAGWTIRDLVEHMVGQNFGFAMAIGTGDAAIEEYRPRDTSQWDASVAALTAAVSTPADGIRLIEVPREDRFSLPAVLAMHTLDTAVHLWDAVGDDYVPSAETVAVVLAQAERIATRAPAGGPFDAPLPTHDDTDWHRALRPLGRAA